MNQAQRDYTHTVLVALLNRVPDFEIVKTEGWYRIPVDSAPALVRDGRVKMLAFYHSSAFELEKYSIRWVANVKNIEILTRQELFPNEIPNPKSGRSYYKIELYNLRELEQVIFSPKNQRILFLTTSPKKLFSATQINQLFEMDAKHELVWNLLQSLEIKPELEFPFTCNKKVIIADFAIFCRKKTIFLVFKKLEGSPFLIKDDLPDFMETENQGMLIINLPFSTQREVFLEAMQCLEEKIREFGGLK